MNADLIKRDVALTAPQAEFILGALNSVTKEHGLTHAASALTIAHLLQQAFKEEGTATADSE